MPTQSITVQCFYWTKRNANHIHTCTRPAPGNVFRERCNINRPYCPPKWCTFLPSGLAKWRANGESYYLYCILIHTNVFRERCNINRPYCPPKWCTFLPSRLAKWRANGEPCDVAKSSVDAKGAIEHTHTSKFAGNYV